MQSQFINKINGVYIVTVERDGEIFVPIKPICDAIGINADGQRIKLRDDEFFNSTTEIISVVAADGKEREMYCIRLRDVYGWLATINSGKVAPEAREAVSRYRRECYDVLYDHFTGSIGAPSRLTMPKSSSSKRSKMRSPKRRRRSRAVKKQRRLSANSDPSASTPYRACSDGNLQPRR